MGLLAEQKSRRKLNHDPNNTRWTRDTTTFGQKILRAQGWQPGEYLGAQNAPHSELHTSANASYIRVSLKDDMNGLGFNKKEEEFSGLEEFGDVLSRLNGKTDAAVAKQKEDRMVVKMNAYVQSRYGPMRFVRGGLLVGDEMKVEEEKDGKSETKKTGPADDGKEQEKKKSKKRKAASLDDEEQDEGSSSQDSDFNNKKKRRKDDKKKSKKRSADSSTTSETDSKKAKLKKKDKEASSSSKSKKSKLKREDSQPGSASASEDSDDEAEERSQSKEERRAAKRARKEEKRAKKELKKKQKKAEKEEKKRKKGESSGSSAESTAKSTPAGSGASTPQFVNPHRVRSRFLAAKREAYSNDESMRKIWMVRA